MPMRDDLDLLLAEGRASGLVRRLLELARDEDLGPSGDVTGQATIPADRRGRYRVVPRAPAVLSGLGFLPDLSAIFAPSVRVDLAAADGDRVSPGQTVATLDGPVRDILALERTMLNLICRLSGVATRTAEFVAAMGPRPNGRPDLCDTRKTTPGLRIFEKYAVRCGGGRSHRLGLHDAVLIKDNHLVGAAPQELPGIVETAIRRAHELRPHGLKFCEVEVDTLAQFEALLRRPPSGLGIVLLDNMGVPDLKSAVGMRDRAGSGLLLEASGGVNLHTVREIADTGVDRISVGSLTHGAVSIDFGLDAFEA